MHLYRPSENRGILPILYFHAMARLGIEGLLIIEPRDYFVSVGAFDDVNRIIDVEWCRNNGVPIVRRETGGGPVLLGPGQVFYNLVVKRGHPRVPGVVERAYRYLSQAPIATYRQLGIDVQYRPINDLVTADAKKIAGQGAADIEGCFCFVGSILRRFDVDFMCRVLRAPNEVFRARLRASMDGNMSWIEREMDQAPDGTAIATALGRAFADILGELPEATLPAPAHTLAAELGEKFTSSEALGLETGRAHHAIKIREGVYLYRGIYRSTELDVETQIEVVDDHIAAITFEGEPRLAELATALKGIAFDAPAIGAIVQALAGAFVDERSAYGLTQACLGKTVQEPA